MKKLYFTLVAALLVFAACKKDKPLVCGTTDECSVKIEALTAKSNDFGFDLLKRVYAVEEKDNLMLSPYSVSTALGMLLNGAAGDTRTQMEEMLGFSDLSLQEINTSYKALMNHLLLSDPDIDLRIANSIWQKQNYTIHKDFLSLNQKYFDANAFERDFSDPKTVDEINAWCAEKTDDKITKIIDHISTEDVMFLINAIYFNGQWKYRFNEDSITNENFYSQNNVFDVEMMHQQAAFNYYEDDSIQFIELPYANEKFVMQIVLPAHDLDNLVNDIDAMMLNSWLNNASDREVIVSVPKFKYDYNKRLNDVLKSLGMVDAFDPFTANLTNISDATQLYTSFVDHFTHIDVNPKGTEAAAVTVVGVSYNSIDDSTTRFKLDKPFMYFISEKESNTILFAGTVKQPDYE